ncbi:MAG: TniB family NTP-binding protein [Anaerolineae bacterium]|nr:TniB family NTP-binding protein [Anaerolineae bacterium]
MGNDPTASPEMHDTLIRYPRFQELHEDIEMCKELSKSSGEPHCMSLEGPTGAGKTTMIQDYARQFARYETPEGIKIPILYMETPSPVTVKGLAMKMLEAMGDPAAHKGTQTSMDSRLVHFIQHCEIELVVLDDFQHLIDSETEKILAKVSNWLKVLIKETGVPFLVVGIEGKVELILKSNSQLSRLFAVREELQRFQWNPSTPETIQEFANFVQATEEVVGRKLPWRSDSDADLLYRLHYATDGVIANLMNLMRGTALLAQKQGRDKLDLDILAAVFEKRLAKHLYKKTNPFKKEWGERFTPPQELPTDQPNATTKRGAKGKKKKPSVAETLSTR